MALQNDPLVSRVQKSYQKLADAANTLNIVSDELGKVIVALDSALKNLNLGITTWVDIQSARSSETGDTSTDQVGYSKINGKWGIAIRSLSAEFNRPFELEGEWLFNEAPRSLRLLAVKKIPELIEGLVEATGSTIQDVTQSLSQSQMLAAAISDVAKQAPKPPK